MEKLIRPVVRVGTSAGVILPIKWLNGRASITLTHKPINPLACLSELKNNNFLSNAKGIYLGGSYARNEQNAGSDIDLLVITENTTKHIKLGKYEINCVSEKDFLTNPLNFLIYYPLLLESKTIINNGLKESLLEKAKEKISDAIRYYLKDTKEILIITSKELAISELKKQKYAENQIGYSLVLRLKTYYIISCIRENKMWKNSEFLKLIKSISGSERIYQAYLSIKNNYKKKNIIPLIEAKKMLKYLEERI